MAYLILQTELFHSWNYGGTSAILRIFASQSFYENTTGEYIAQGQVGNINSPCQEYTCSISGTTLTIPQVTLATTTDSTVPNVVYTAQFYSVQGTLLYTFLSQFFVDQYALTVPAQSAVIITGSSGASEVDGIYTYRQQSGGHNSYNLVGYPDALTTASVTIGSGVYRIYNTSSVNEWAASFGGVTYPWEVGSSWIGSGTVPTAEEYPTFLTSTWEQLTLLNQGSTPWPQPINEYWTTAQVEQYVNSRIGDGTTPFAAELVIGKTALSVDPDIASEPCAIACNDPTYLALIGAGVYVETYGCDQAGLDAAIAAIGSDTMPLIVSCPVTVTTNTTIPANAILTFQGSGAFSINGGVTLTISNMAPTAPYQIFSGAGDAVFDANAVPAFNLSWWAGTSSIADTTHAFAQAALSRTLNGGGILYVPDGEWTVADFDFGDNSIIEGAGNSTNASGGTVITVPFGTTNKSVIQIKGAYRNRIIRNLTISVGSTTTNNCVDMTGSVPDSGINCVFDNVTFHGTGATSVPQVYIHDADGAHAWEAINVQFDHCQWATPGATKSYHIDTVNSLVTFNGRQANVPVDGIFGYLEYSGWTYDNSPDNRGVAGLTPITESNRTIRIDCAFGTKACTVTSGTITLNDIGQQVILNNGILIQTTNITGITSATAFTIEDNATLNMTDDDCEILWYEPDTAGAMAVWHIVHGHNTLQIDNNTDEGFQYFIINDASDNLSPINVNGGIIQSRIQLNAACVINVNGTRMLSQTFDDINNIQATILMTGNSMSSTTINGVVLLEPRIFGLNNGTSMIPIDFNYGFNGGTFAALNRQTIGVPTWFLQDSSHPGALTTPLLGVFAADITTGGPHKRLIAWGRTEPTSEIPDYYFWLARDYDTGFALYAGNQTLPNRGHQFDATVYSDTTFAGSRVNKTITTDEANWNPGDSSQFIRATLTGGDWTLSGLGIPDSLATKATGEMHELWNVGSAHTLTILNNNAGSSAANRFLCDTGGDIPLQPNEGIDLWYDAEALTSGRWRVSKKNITGLTSTSTEIDAAIPVVMSDTLTCASAIIVGGADIGTKTTIGAGDAFTFDFVPDNGGMGTAFLGNLANNQYIALDENAGTLSMVTTDMDIGGTLQVTGTTDIVGAFRVTGTAGLGYGVGSGSTVTQITSRTTQVTIDKICGSITLFSDTGSATPFTFKVNNSTVVATDVIILNQKTGNDVYALNVNSVGAGAFYITVTDITSTTSEAPTINFAVIKAIAS